MLGCLADKTWLIAVILLGPTQGRVSADSTETPLSFQIQLEYTIQLPFHGQSDITMPKDIQVPRQRPVSCRLCRTRKLRCSREAPCSNCVSRGVACELEPYAVPVRSPSVTISTPSEPDLFERIRKLEQIVEQQQVQLQSSSNQNSQAEEQQTQQISHQIPSVEDNIASEVFDADVASHAQHIPKPSLFPEIANLDKDVAWLESIYSGHDLSVNILFPWSSSSQD